MTAPDDPLYYSKRAMHVTAWRAKKHQCSGSDVLEAIKRMLNKHHQLQADLNKKRA